MTTQEELRKFGYLFGRVLICVLMIASISVVLFGRLDIMIASLCAGITAVSVVLLMYRFQNKPSGNLIRILIVVLGTALVAMPVILIAADSFIPAGGTNPQPPGQIVPVPLRDPPWMPPDMDVLGRDLNDTAALLALPIGGFEEGRVFISSYSLEGFADYILDTRELAPTTIELRVFSVQEIRSSDETDPYEDLNASISPNRFDVTPGWSYSARSRST